MNPTLFKNFACLMSCCLLLAGNVGAKQLSNTTLRSVLCTDNVRNTKASYVLVNNNLSFTETTVATPEVFFGVKTLPLTLISFTATKLSSGKVELTWKTAQEINVSHFYIERSLDGRKWVRIGQTTAKGQQGTVETYSFTDSKPEGDVNYYRLHVIDYDAKSDYSPVRLITMKDVPVRIYPNLARSNGTLYVEGISPEVTLLELYDNRGLLKEKIKLYSNSFTLPTLRPGIYHVRISNAVNNQVACMQKIVVL
jgi:hypothetical protein